ncbi:hypothetical protein GBAR_LOCUS17152 [Geodia barretti]|uniref:Uncharacterized protein n=1 Tax=Geodia barretti TaxID=519541 RepID=A0AA35WVB8_GEOBA|nr:hypothetical protein GBAR_LOCUS17152 [Geodia barretti]
MHVCIRAECAKASAVQCRSYCVCVCRRSETQLSEEAVYSQCHYPPDGLLLAFNTAEQHSFSSLLFHTGLDNQEMTYTLQSLLTSKLLLLQDEETSLHGADCVVCLNQNYSNKRQSPKLRLLSKRTHNRRWSRRRQQHRRTGRCTYRQPSLES